MIRLISIITWLTLLTGSRAMAQQAGCEDLLVTGIELKPNPLDGDSTSLIEVVMINLCEKCTGGPDYTGLYVINGTDTLGSVAINGIPRYQKSARTYPAFCGVLLTELPDAKELRISLDHYCDNIPIDLERKTRRRDRLFGEK